MKFMAQYTYITYISMLYCDFHNDILNVYLCTAHRIPLSATACFKSFSQEISDRVKTAKPRNKTKVQLWLSQEQRCFELNAVVKLAHSGLLLIIF